MKPLVKPILAAGLLAAVAIAPAHAQSPDTVVAKVGDSTITFADVLAARERMPEQFAQVPVEQIYPLLVNGLIDSRLATAEARRQGLQNDDEVRRMVREFEGQVIERILVANYVRERMTDEALRAEYDKLVAAEQGKTEIHTRHILLEDRAAADAVIRDLDAGADFAELATARSTGPSAPRGGDLDWTVEGMLVPAYESAAKALAEGAYTQEPVQTQFGWHVIKLEGRRDKQPPTFEDAQRQLQMRVTRRLADELVSSLRDGVKIEKFDLDGNPVE